MLNRLPLALLCLSLAACDIPGLGPDPRIAQREADAKAVGAACRHALRGIEECYRQNERASKSAVFEGWKEMDQYMRDNKVEGVPPRESKLAQGVEEIVENAQPAAGGKAVADSRNKANVASQEGGRAPARSNGN